jgi:hypothetical protein
MVAVGPNAPAVPPQDANHARQSIDLLMKNTRLQRIVAAELEVHGTSNKSRLVPAGGAVLTNEPTADAVRNVHLANSVPAEQSRTRTVSVNDLTSVAWISVIELRYADGSTWHARPGGVPRDAGRGDADRGQVEHCPGIGSAVHAGWNAISDDPMRPVASSRTTKRR